MKNFTFLILSSLKLNFSTTFFGTTYLCTILLKADAGNIRKIVNFTYTLKIWTNYKLPVFRTNFLILKFWKLLSNSYCPKQLLTLKMSICSPSPTLTQKMEILMKKKLSKLKQMKQNQIGQNCWKHSIWTNSKFVLWFHLQWLITRKLEFEKWSKILHRGENLIF